MSLVAARTGRRYRPGWRTDRARFTQQALQDEAFRGSPGGREREGMAEVHGGFMRIEESAKRVRAVLGGEVVLDTLRPRLVWDGAPYPSYFIPEADVRTELLTPATTA